MDSKQREKVLEDLGKAIAYGYLPDGDYQEYSIEQVEEAIHKVRIHDAVPETWTRVERDDGTVVGLRRIMVDGEEHIECKLWSEVS